MLFSTEISLNEAELIGKRIYANECSSKADKLIWWNDGEDFASLGIGHFIWYPENKHGPFEEAFPLLLTFLSEQGTEPPAWLKSAKGCPWNSKEEFLKKESATQKKELQDILTQSIALQAMFIVQRFEQSLSKLLDKVSEQDKSRITKHLEKLQESLQGKYALIDYHNFKGAGIAESEQYKGEGWGLKQVLEKMPENEKDPLLSFTNTAKDLLKRRVQNAPEERKEERWLPGWLSRVESYSQNF